MEQELAEKMGPLRQAVTEAAQRVLEAMCFADVTGAEGEEPGDDAFGVEVRFHGSENGLFRMWMNDAVACRLAADFLGLEEAGPEEGRQVALELANMICGSAVSHLSRSGALRLDPPRACAGTAPEGATRLALDAGVVAVTLDEFEGAEKHP
jgi:hypothetical protein